MTGRAARPLPFHGGEAVPGSARRLLLISYHFPPGQATGALRWQKFAAGAAEHGWALDVVTLDPADLKQADLRRLADLPPGTRVFGARERVSRVETVLDGVGTVAASLRRGARGGKGNGSTSAGAAAVDTRLVYPWQLNGSQASPAGLKRAFNAWRAVTRDDPWGNEAAAVAAGIVDPAVHAAILSCGPPHAAHMAAARVARRSRLPLILDLRDPWGLAQAVDRSRASPLFFSMRSRRESACVRAAALVIVNSETHQMALRAVHRQAADRIQCVLNGGDEEVIPAGPRDERFTIAYAGNIYLDRDPRSVFAAAARVVRELSLTPRQFGIDLIGSVESFGGRSTADLARDAGLEGYVHLHGRRPRAEALAFLSRAAMLLSLPQELDLSVPSKLYEYLQFQAWLLALARPVSGTAVLLRGTGADVVEPDDVAGIAAIIARRYREYAGGAEPPRLMELNPHLTRTFQAKRLFSTIGAAIARTAAAAR